MGIRDMFGAGRAAMQEAQPHFRVESFAPSSELRVADAEADLGPVVSEFENATAAERGYGVDAELIPDSSRPTTVKKRYRAHEKTLLRVNQFRDHEIDRDIQSTINNKAKDLLADVDLLILSDFSYGLLSSALVRALINEARS